MFEPNEKTVAVYAVKNSVLSRISINLPSRVIKKVPWLVDRSTSMATVLETMIAEEVDSMLVVGENGQVEGAVTTNLKIRIRCGTGDLQKKACIEDCKRACGGWEKVKRCWVMADTGDCWWKCKEDDAWRGNDSTVGDYLDRANPGDPWG